jgi:hypothetical protein
MTDPELPGDLNRRSRDDLKAALLALGRKLLSVDGVALWKLKEGHPVEVDAGIWGILRLQLVDLEEVTAADFEQYEAREKFLAEVPDDGKPHFEWVEDQ